MLDILHYFFEEDYRTVSQDAALRISAVRETLYQSLYETNYPYAIAASAGVAQNAYKYDPSDFADDEEFDTTNQLSDVKAFSPAARPYTPANQPVANSPKPFGDILDAPLG